MAYRELIVQMAKEALPGMKYADEHSDIPFPLIRDTAMDLVGAEVMREFYPLYFDYSYHYEERNHDLFDYSECTTADLTEEEYTKNLRAKADIAYAEELGEKVIDHADTYLAWKVSEEGYDLEADELGYLND